MLEEVMCRSSAGEGPLREGASMVRRGGEEPVVRRERAGSWVCVAMVVGLGSGGSGGGGEEMKEVDIAPRTRPCRSSAPGTMVDLNSNRAYAANPPLSAQKAGGKQAKPRPKLVLSCRQKPDLQAVAGLVGLRWPSTSPSFPPRDGTQIHTLPSGCPLPMHRSGSSFNVTSERAHSQSPPFLRVLGSRIRHVSSHPARSHTCPLSSGPHAPSGSARGQIWLESHLEPKQHPIVFFHLLAPRK